MIALKMPTRLSKRFNSVCSYFTLFIFVLFSGMACDQSPAKRKYDEVVISPTSMSAENVPTPQNLPKLAWATPDGWTARGASGFRLATFATEGENAIECSISSLGSLMDDLKGNVIRWMNQIHLTDVSDEQLKQLLDKREKFKTDGGLEIEMIDLTKLQALSDSEALSMIVGIVQLTDTTIFIKMTGTKAAVFKNIEPFKRLCQSLKVQP